MKIAVRVMLRGNVGKSVTTIPANSLSDAKELAKAMNIGSRLAEICVVFPSRISGSHFIPISELYSAFRGDLLNEYEDLMTAPTSYPTPPKPAFETKKKLPI